jgi:hypothetical protein
MHTKKKRYSCIYNKGEVNSISVQPSFLRPARVDYPSESFTYCCTDSCDHFFGGDIDGSDKPSDKAALVNPVTWATLKAVLFAHLTAQYLEHLDYMQYNETFDL